LSLNNAGQIVGTTAASSGAIPVPFFFAHGLMSPLNTLVSATDPSKRYVTLTAAYGINDSGQIIAVGTDSRAPGTTRAYLLTPTTPFAGSVDLQASLTTVTAGTPFTLYWTAQNLSSCTASGGSGSDGWQGSAAANGGQQQVTETKGGSYDFELDCATAIGGSETSSVTVTVNAKPAPPSGGGGGALGGETLLALLALALLRTQPRPVRA
jgi:hypothetical protein